MRLLLDTHVILWAVDDPAHLGPDARLALQDLDNELLVSIGTIWELSIKVGLGKLGLSLPFREWVDKAIADLSLTVLPISVQHADTQARLPFHHRDPFDRLIIAMAIVEQVSIVSSDGVFEDYGITRIW